MRKNSIQGAGFEAPPALPGVHHPIFEDKPGNYDRERNSSPHSWSAGRLYVFQAFYRELVEGAV